MMKDKITLEELAWTCGCGTAMALELPYKKTWLDLWCRNCGIVASISIRLKDIKMVSDDSR